MITKFVNDITTTWKGILYAFLLSIPLNILFLPSKTIPEFLLYTTALTPLIFHILFVTSVIILYSKNKAIKELPLRVLIKMPAFGLSIMLSAFLILFTFWFSTSMGLLWGLLGSGAVVGLTIYVFVFSFSYLGISKTIKIFEKLGKKLVKIDTTYWLFYETIEITTDIFTSRIIKIPKTLGPTSSIFLFAALRSPSNAVFYGWAAKRMESLLGKTGEVYSIEILLNIPSEGLEDLNNLINRAILLKNLKNMKLISFINKKFPEMSNYITTAYLLKTNRYKTYEEPYLRICIETKFLEENINQVYEFLCTLKKEIEITYKNQTIT